MIAIVIPCLFFVVGCCYYRHHVIGNYGCYCGHIVGCCHYRQQSLLFYRSLLLLLVVVIIILVNRVSHCMLVLVIVVDNVTC